jgi:hypothetical protein
MAHAPQTGIDHTALEQRLSSPRLTPYLAATGQDRKKAIALYQWNIEVSGAIYEALHVFEVILRNTLDDRLCKWNATQTNPATGQLHGNDWVFDPAPLLQRICGKDLGVARGRATQSVSKRAGSAVARHEDVLAQLTLGTWRFLLPAKRDPGKQSLWQNALSHGFPNLQRPANQLVAAVHSVYQLRNRVAHLEPLLRTNLQAEYKNMRTVIDAVDPKTLVWFTSINRIAAVGRARPRP